MGDSSKHRRCPLSLSFWDLLAASVNKSEFYPKLIWWVADPPPIVIPGEDIILVYCQTYELPLLMLLWLSVDEDNRVNDDDDDKRASRALALLIDRPPLRCIGDASGEPRGRRIGDDSMHRWMLRAMHRRRGRPSQPTRAVWAASVNKSEMYPERIWWFPYGPLPCQTLLDVVCCFLGDLQFKIVLKLPDEDPAPPPPCYGRPLPHSTPGPDSDAEVLQVLGGLLHGGQGVHQAVPSGPGPASGLSGPPPPSGSSSGPRAPVRG